MIDALQLAQKGYPARYTYEEFAKQFRVLLLHLGLHDAKTSHEETAMALLEKVGDLTPNDYKKGTTKMFLKKSTARLLDGRQGKVLRSGAALVEDLIRMAASSRVKRSYTEAKERFKRMQAFGRGFQERYLIKLRKRRVQTIWGVTCLAFAVRRYQRDRLARARSKPLFESW